MKNLASWLLTFMMILFWGFRIIVAFCESSGIDIGIHPLDINVEIVLLFITLLCIILVVKRKLLGSILYLISYGSYFGVNLFNTVMKMSEEMLSLAEYSNLFFSFVGMVIPIAVLFDMLLDKNRKAHPRDKKTDWFYKNEQYDRELDERADKNNYRTM